MPAIRVYKCTRCGRGADDGVTRDLLLVKKVTFLEMGTGGRTQRSRVMDWLCPRCTATDEDWNKPAFIVPEGTLERVPTEPVEAPVSG